MHIPHRDRVIEPELLSQDGRVLGRNRPFGLANERIDRIAGNEIQHEEDETAHQEEHGNDGEKPPENVRGHAATAFLAHDCRRANNVAPRGSWCAVLLWPYALIQMS
jgi:hypothetical protein